MTLEEIIEGLKFTVDMFLFDPSTGETFTESRNDMDKTTIDACKGAIELLEQTQWIPVSERLPEDGSYLVAIKSIVGEPRISIRSFAKDLNKVDEFDFPKHKCGWYGYDSEYGHWEDTDVIAWMPLPEPYTEGGTQHG